VQAELEQVQVQNRVPDKLARPVVRHIPAPVCLADLNPHPGEEFRRSHHVAGGACATADGHDGVVLKQEKGADPWPARFAVGEHGGRFGFLPLVRGGVADPAKIHDAEHVIHDRW